MHLGNKKLKTAPFDGKPLNRFSLSPNVRENSRLGCMIYLKTKGLWLNLMTKTCYKSVRETAKREVHTFSPCKLLKTRRIRKGLFLGA